MRRGFHGKIAALLLSLVLVIGVFPVWAAGVESLYPYIIASLPISGYVRNLIVPKKTPDFLFALVGFDGKPKPSDKPGLYIFDVSRATEIKKILYLPVKAPIGMEPGPDGHTVFVYAYRVDHDPEGGYGVLALDVSDPHAVKEIWRLDTDIVQARLSVDGDLLFVQERATAQKSDPTFIFSIFRVSPANKPTLLSRVERKMFSDFFPTPDGRHLILNDRKDFVVYDITDPSAPTEMSQLSPDLGYPEKMGRDGTFFILDNDGLVLASIIPEVTRIGVLRGGGSIHCISDDNKTAYMSTIDKNIQVIDLTDKTAPKVTAQYANPNYVGSIAPARDDKLIYVGLLGSIVVIDPAKAILTSESLIKAHAEALRQYQRKDVKSDFFKTGNAINLLQAAGIDQALENKPSGISDRKLARILNDYGFFLTKRYGGGASDIYKRAIELDPGRAIAYLNLGDCLRKQLSVADSFQEKISLTKGIKLAYLQYKKLKGKSTPTIDSFLGLNVVDKSIADFCEYVAAYASQGRLRELFGSGRSVKKRDGQGTMRVEITYEGTGHYPYVHFNDNKTNQDIEVETPDNERNRPWAAEIDIVPFLDGHHLLYHTGDYLVDSEPIGLAARTGKGCGFTTCVTESFDKKGKDTEVCRLVLSSKHPSFISFNESCYLDAETLHNAGYTENWTQEDSSGEVDFDNDGKTETLVHLKYASGAGPACDYDFFDLLNEQKNGFSKSESRSLLLEMQGMRRGPHDFHPVPHCRGNVTGWFRYKGITYFETKYPEEQPKNPDQEFHTISFIKDGKIHKVCEACFKLQIEAQQLHETASQVDLSVNEQLLQAAERGRLEKVKELLEQGGDVNGKSEDGRTILIQAVHSGNLKLVEFLADKEADLNARDAYGTALTHAARRLNLQMVRLFVRKGADVHAKDADGNTALSYVAGSGNPELVQALIDKGAGLNAKEELGKALVHAAEKGQLDIMKILLRKGADANAKDESGHTALIQAVQSRKLVAVQLLMDTNVDVNARTGAGGTALMAAVSSGNLELVKYLIDKGADVHAESLYGHTALLAAASRGNLEVLKLLIEKGVDVRAKNQKGDTALMRAMSRGNLELLHFLIDRGVDVNAMNKYGETALMFAAGTGRLDVVKLLIEKGADVNATGRLGQTPLQSATNGKHLEVMKFLIDKGADLNGKTPGSVPPLMEAARKGNLDLVKFLLDHGADVNAKHQRRQEVLVNAVEIRIGEGADADRVTEGGETALMAAASSGHLELVKFLIDKGADVYAKDLYGGTVLMAAASQPKLEVLKFFIDKGLDLKAKNNRGDTTLMSAASQGNLEILKFLIDRGVDVNATNKDGYTALTRAVLQHHIEILRFLVDRGADVNAKSTDGVTVLMRASTGGNLEILKLLIARGADVNTMGKQGETALLFATIANRPDVMKLLIDKGAHVNGHGSTGYTPLMEAASTGNLELVKFLINKGADVNARDERGRTIIQGAGVEIFFDGGTDVDKRTQVGRTALMGAVESGNLDVVKVLIDHGADVNVTCRGGETALGLASAANRPEIVQYLKAQGAKSSVPETAAEKDNRAPAERSGFPKDEPPPLPPIEEAPKPPLKMKK